MQQTFTQVYSVPGSGPDTGDLEKYKDPPWSSGESPLITFFVLEAKGPEGLGRERGAGRVLKHGCFECIPQP